MIIGLTGGLATGKTTIARLLQAEGYMIIDADRITHELYAGDPKTVAAIATLFPEAVRQGCVHRPTLAQEIAACPSSLPALEALMHPLILAVIQNKIRQTDPADWPVVLVAPLLFETKMDCLCDRVVCLYAPLETQKQRAFARADMTSTKFEALIARQWTNVQRQYRADLYVSTTESIETTYQKIKNYLNCF